MINKFCRPVYRRFAKSSGSMYQYTNRLLTRAPYTDYGRYWPANENRICEVTCMPGALSRGSNVRKLHQLRGA